jgi:hypothetical protein
MGASPAVAILHIRSPRETWSVVVEVSQRRREIWACRRKAEVEEVVEE